MNLKNVGMMKVTTQTFEDVKEWIAQFNYQNFNETVRLQNFSGYYAESHEFYFDCRNSFTFDVLYCHEIHEGDWLILGKDGKFHTCAPETMEAIVDVVTEFLMIQ